MQSASCVRQVSSVRCARCKVVRSGGAAVSCHGRCKKRVNDKGVRMGVGADLVASYLDHPMGDLKRAQIELRPP
jgi:hypothetical protein